MCSTGFLLYEVALFTLRVQWWLKMKDKLTRKTCQQLRVPVYPDEKKIIEAKAKATGKTVASFLREVALGYEVKSVIDNSKVLELSKINGDLGRLGGLLKLWLTDDAKLNAYNKQQLEATIHGALEMIKKNQDEMFNAIVNLNI